MATTSPTAAAPGTTTPTWSGLVGALLAGHDLTAAEAAWAVTRAVRGEATAAQIAAFVVALRAKGETSEELAGMADALRANALPVTIPGPTVDLVGTGGDGLGALNISTMASIVVAATGITVVKHGGRAASSSTAGSADLVEHLGVSLELTPAAAAEVAVQAGITYLFAPRFNPGLRHVAAVRRELRVPTAFNLLGPLINPAAPAHQLVGVADPQMLPLIASVLAARSTSALVVRGDDGLDKLTTVTESQVWVVRDGQVRQTRLDPRELGVRAEPGDLRGGDAAANAATCQRLLGGEPGPVRDVVLLNAAAALATVGKPEGTLVEQLAAGMNQCAAAIDSGAAAAVLRRWAAASHAAKS